MSDTDEKPMKALYDHCVTVFEEMMKEAVPEEQYKEVAPGSVGPGERIPMEGTGYYVWTGHLTQLFARLGMATPYYTSVMNSLKKMSCVEQIKRGGGNSMSKWRLVRAPEEEFFHAAEKLKSPVQGSLAALEQQFRDMNSRVGALEDSFQNLIQAGSADV